jgi:hypothetical protein
MVVVDTMDMMDTIAGEGGVMKPLFFRLSKRFWRGFRGVL